MTFDEMLPNLKDGWAVTRPSWGKKVIVMFKPEFFHTVTLPFIYIEMDGKMFAIYSASQDDLFADDFELVEYRT